MVCPNRTSLHIECASNDRTSIFESRDVVHLKNGAETGAGCPKYRIAAVPVAGAAVSADDTGPGGFNVIGAPGKHLTPMHRIVVSVDGGNETIPLQAGRDACFLNSHQSVLLFELLMELYASWPKTILDCPPAAQMLLQQKPCLSRSSQEIRNTKFRSAIRMPPILMARIW